MGMGMRRIIFVTLISLFVAAYAFSAKAQPRITGIRIILPPGVNWERVSHSGASSMYVNVWVPKGLTSENSPWKIMSARMPFGRHVSARRFSQSLIGRFEQGCNNSDTVKLKKIVVSGYSSYAWTMTCADRSDKKPDAFNSFRVISGFRSIYLVRSRLYLSSSGNAGSETANKSEHGSGETLNQRKAASEKMVTSGVIVCVLGQKKC